MKAYYKNSIFFIVSYFILFPLTASAYYGHMRLSIINYSKNTCRLIAQNKNYSMYKILKGSMNTLPSGQQLIIAFKNKKPFFKKRKHALEIELSYQCGEKHIMLKAGNSDIRYKHPNGHPYARIVSSDKGINAQQEIRYRLGGQGFPAKNGYHILWIIYDT